MLALQGQADLLRALRYADRATRLGMRKQLRAVAEPVRRQAEVLALEDISGMHKSPKWARMRVGVSQKLVYVAPRQRGVKTKGRSPLRRPNLAGLLMGRAMEPALKQNERATEQALERMLDRVADDFNRGGRQ